MWDILEKYTVAPSDLSDGELLALDEVLFRARLCEQTYHRLCTQFYRAMGGGKPVNSEAVETVKHMCNLWTQRQFPLDDADYQYAKTLLDFVGKQERGEPVDLSPYTIPVFNDKDREVMFKVIYGRRSIRAFQDRDVPDELLDKVMDAGLNAAHSSNLNSIRYLVIREKNEPWIFRGSDIPLGPVHIAVLQDDRCYLTGNEKSLKNRIFDAGAATLNILYAIFANGLDGVWLTYSNEMIDHLRQRFKLPDYIRIVDFIDLGYGDQTPYPPQRPTVEERVIVRI